MGTKTRVRLSTLLALSLVVLVAGCGSGSSSDDSSSSGGSTSGPDLDRAKAAVEKGYAGTGREPSSQGPPAQKGKKVTVISCTQAAPGCSIPAAGAEEAGKKLGWDMTLVDGKADPGIYNSAMRQALAAGTDGIVLVAIDCPAVKSSLELAKKQGVPVVAAYGFDCDDPKIGGAPLLAGTVNYGTKTPGEFFTEWGRLQADYVIAKTGGDAKIIVLGAPEYLLFRYKADGFVEQIKKNCPDCEIVARQDVPVTGLSNGKAVQQVQTLLAQHPETNVLVPGYDAMTMTIASSQAVRAKVKSGMLLVGSEGYIPNMELIAEGVQTASIGIPAEWIGWAGADALNRIIAGDSEIPDQGIGYTIIDKDHNLPPEGENWVPNIDFRSAFEKVWAGKD